MTASSVGRTTVVIATRNRADELMTTLSELYGPRPRVPVIVVDNASDDDTVSRVGHRFPAVTVVSLRRNHGAGARNIGAAHARTPYVAFSDDDSWWDGGALPLAEHIFDRHPRLGLIAARPLVGPECRPDPITALMAHSPLGQAADLPGPTVLGFLGCAAIVRRTAFLGVGGFSPILFFVGEERLLAWDLAAAGWTSCYVDKIVAHHHPSDNRQPAAVRRCGELRNHLLTALLRRPVRVGWSTTSALARAAAHDHVARRAFVAALVRLPRALAARRPVPVDIERQITRLERASR